MASMNYQAPIGQQQPIQEEIVTSSTTTSAVNPNNNLNSRGRTNSNTSGRKSGGLFGRKKAQSTNYSTNNGYNNSVSRYPLQDVAISPIGVGDVTHHSYRWAHRDKNLVASDAYGGAPPRGSKVSSKRNRKSLNNRGSNAPQQPVVSQTSTATSATQGLTGYPQQTVQTTITEEVPAINNNNLPANNIPTQKKRSHPFQSLFGRKHHDSGAHAGMLGSGPTGGLGLPSRANVVA